MFRSGVGVVEARYTGSHKLARFRRTHLHNRAASVVDVIDGEDDTHGFRFIHHKNPAALSAGMATAETS